MKGIIKRDKIIKFVLEHQREDGGFSFAKTTPSTLVDTYFALKTFSELDHNYYDDKTQKYIKSMNLDAFKDVKQVYMLIWLNKCFGIKIKNVDWKDYNLSKKLDQAYYFAKIKKLTANRFCLNYDYVKYKNMPPKHLSNALKVIYVFDGLEKEFNRDAYTKYIQRCQNNDGGFGFFPGTTSFIENTYHALKALTLLNKYPDYLDECIQFILSCQSKDGGFGRNVMTVPTVEYTYYSVKSLNILTRMKRWQCIK